MEYQPRQDAKDTKIHLVFDNYLSHQLLALSTFDYTQQPRFDLLSSCFKHRSACRLSAQLVDYYHCFNPRSLRV